LALRECELKFRAAEFCEREISTRGIFSTVIHTFAQIFWTNFVDGEKREDYFARQIEPEALKT
jgi:hypothetical protein